MSKINKIVFASFIAIGIAFSFQFDKLEAASRFDGSVWVEAPASSGAIAGFSKGCSVKAVYASSNTATTTSANWFCLLSTPGAGEGISGISTFLNSQYRSPAMYFPVISSETTNTYSGVYKVLEYGESGISFSSAPYIYKNGATSGQAQRVWLEIIP